MPLLTLAAAGTRQKFTSADGSLPTQRWCRSVEIVLETLTIKGGASDATVYIGLQNPLGVSNTVSSAVWDLRLSLANQSTVIGLGSDANDIDLGSLWWDSDTTGAQISFLPETT